MNRKIEFRGLAVRTDGANEWIYGYLSDENFIYDKKVDMNILVVKQTIGQYTGLKDKNGKKIFEGDIVKISYRYEDNIYSGAIKFGEFSYSHCDEYRCTHYGWFIDCPNESYCSNTGFDLYALTNECEVIGTIFDKENNNE